MADTATKTAGDATKNLPGAGTLSQVDPAKSDVQGGRKPGDEKGTTVDKEEKKNSLRINIELDIDIEIQLTARIKGDITIGLL